MELFQKLKYFRKILGLTQEDFAKLFDVSPRTVIRWENSKSLPQSGALKKVQKLSELLHDEQSRKELVEVAEKSDGIETLRSILSQSNFPSSAGISPPPNFNNVWTNSPFGIITPPGGVLGKSPSSFWSAYKILKNLFERDKKTDSAKNADYSCPICGCKETDKLLHCTGMVSETLPCTFIVCKACIYSSRESHLKHSPSCNCIDVPAFEPVED